MNTLSLKTLVVLIACCMHLSAMQEKQVQQGESKLVNSTILFLKEKKDNEKTWYEEVYALTLNPKRNCFKRDAMSNDVFIALHGDDFQNPQSPFPFSQFFGKSDIGLIKEEAVDEYKKNLRWYQRLMPVTFCVGAFCAATTYGLSWFFKR